MHEGESSADLDQGILGAGLIIHGNISEPRFTYQDMSPGKRGTSGAPESLRTNLAVTRSRIACGLSAPTNLNLTFIWGKTDISKPFPATSNALANFGEGTMTNQLVVAAASVLYNPLRTASHPTSSDAQYGISALLELDLNVGEGSAVLHRTDGGFACNATLEDVDIDTTLTLPDSQFNALNQQLRRHRWKTFTWTVERMGDKQPERWANLDEKIFYLGWFQKRG
ncbi:uncharacterized protein K444DRAFT_633054 [Hyaloscypha bicolor E]|uniref:Uncharacterized protein n=1 Tax=Hyaloscypha bicolor E TaxID=1095630 RepID=A0A2J6T0X8_9HELO|nr:uncharacterized protein K444DRAFT_633054 [Hyaloscypha bicolor E]PMD56675.1 hypothetical protein K444DRAFT_633054 [Hyaloscypha bicolor E]